MAEPKEQCERPRDAAIREGMIHTNAGFMGSMGSSGWQSEGIYPKEVRIQKVDNGFIVRVGCKEFVATCWGDVSSGLDLYFIDPEAAEKLYCNQAKAGE